MYISGVRVDFELNKEQILAKIDALIAGGNSHLISTVNPEFIMAAQNDREFKRILNSSSICVPDGSGLFFARDFLTTISHWERNFLFPIKAFIYGSLFWLTKRYQTVTGADLLFNICSNADNKGYTVFFLGGQSDKYDVAHNLATYMSSKYKNMNVVGAASKFVYSEQDDDKTLQYIHKCMKERHVNKIDILFVAYGHNRQESWIIRNNEKIPAKVAIGVGGSFEFAIGLQKRASKVVQSMNLEWLFRLIMQPSRIGRVLVAFPIFPLFIFYSVVRKCFK